MTQQPELESLAAALWQARRDGTLIDPTISSLSLEQSYTVQETIARLSESDIVGFKVGSTSERAQAKLGTTEPGAGHLLDRYCYADNADVAIYPAHNVHVEAEFAFRIGRDIACHPGVVPDHENLAGHIDCVVPAIELVGSRLVKGISASGRELITADCGANVGFVSGEQRTNWQPSTLADHPVTVRLNAQTVATGTGADALGHPLNVLQWLTQHCARRKLTLNAGTIVTTGTCSGLIAVKPGDTVEADFGQLGTVTTTFVHGK